LNLIFFSFFPNDRRLDLVHYCAGVIVANASGGGVGVALSVGECSVECIWSFDQLSPPSSYCGEVKNFLKFLQTVSIGS
jgi:hypothetical protein